MAFPIWLIAVIAIGGLLCGSLVCYVGIFFGFVNSRNHAVKVLSNLRYIPEVIEEKEVIVETPKRLSKRQLRRKNMRETDRQMRLNFKRNRSLGFSSDEEDDDAPAQQLPKGVSTKVLSWVATAFSSKSSKIHDIESGKMSKKRSSSRFSFGFSSKSESADSEDGFEKEGSSRSKRFISLDRLQRREARLMLVKPKAAVVQEVPEEEEEVVYDNVVSLLSLAVAKKKRVAEIMENRKLRKGPGEATVDVIALNAGPSAEMIPQGYELVPQTFGPSLVDPDVLIYKRILYLWDGSVSNIKGWFLGTVVGISENAGYNFRIKYDREETKSIFVDGIQPVFLSLSGENAFGRRWVALQKIGKEDSVEERKS